MNTCEIQHEDIHNVNMNDDRHNMGRNTIRDSRRSPHLDNDNHIINDGDDITQKIKIDTLHLMVPLA